MGYISDAAWDRYRQIINDAHDDFSQDTITLVKLSWEKQRWGEDNKSLEHTTSTDLKCLIAYNIFRTWPMSKETEYGQFDKESIAVYLNKQYLVNNGYTNAEGYLDFDPGKDYFIHMGQKYRGSGETPVAQAKNDPLFILLILRKVPIHTGEERY